MRAGWVVVGIVVAVIGAALLFVPVVPQSNETVNSSSSTPYVIVSVGGYSLTGNVPVAVSWSTSGSASVEVLAGACSGTCNDTSQVSGITSQNGTSGSFTLNQPNGGEIIMGVVYGGSPAVTVTFKITTALSTVGTILLVVGILVLIIGIVLRGKPKASAAAAPPTPAPSTGPGGPPPST